MKKAGRLSVSILLTVLALLLSVSSCQKRGDHSSEHGILVLNEDNFDLEIAEGVVMVDFWATWCAPCRILAPTIQEIAEQTHGKIKVGKVDTDENGTIANRFNIQAIPTVIIFQDGKPVERFMGIQSKETYIQALQKYISL